MATLDQSDVRGVKVLRLAGSLTRDGVDQVEMAFVAALRGEPRVVVDLHGVDLLTTPGISMLLAAERELKQAKGRLVLSGVRGMADEVLRRCKLHTVLSVAPTLEAAVERATDG